MHNPIIFGDSSIIIHAMVSGNRPKNAALCQIFSRVDKYGMQVGGNEYYHILRNNNKLADSQKNEDWAEKLDRPSLIDTSQQFPSHDGSAQAHLN